MKIDLVVIGASKCGTTTLWEYLNRHPEVQMDLIKEPCTFAFKDWNARVNERLKHYAQPEGYIGEASPIYGETQLIPEIPMRIFEHNPQAKLIFMVREPIDRLYSVWRQALSSGHHLKPMYAGKTDVPVSLMPRSFSRAVREYPPFLGACKYGTIFNAYLDYFPAESIKVLFFDDLKANPEAFFASVSRFLGIASIDIGEGIWANDGSNKKVAVTPFVEKFSKLPHVSKCTAILPASFKELVKAPFRQESLKEQQLTQDFVAGVKMSLKDEVSAILEAGGKDEDYWRGW